MPASPVRRSPSPAHCSRARSKTSSRSLAEDLFERPAAWRLEAVEQLGLTGEERIAGLVTGAGYPDALVPLLGGLAHESGLVCDVGAGLGAATWWLGAQGAIDVVGVEAEPDAAGLARRAFGDLPVVAGAATALPLGDGTCTGVAMLGVVSLVEELDATLDEARRVLLPDGRVGITDLCARQPVDSPPNFFRSVDELTDTLAGRGWEVVSVWTAPADLTTRWDAFGDRVDEEIARRHGDSPTYADWRADRDRLGELIADGALELGTVIAAQP